MKDYFSIPILIIAFNRADTLQQVFNMVKKMQPSQLYLAIDGPRKEKEGEIEKCKEVQEIIKQVDWECDIHTRISDMNQGCGFGPANAISWAFETCEKLIILEDDCVPSLSFFTFCEEMLNKYQNDYRVSIISGRSHHPNTKFFKKQDYIFSRYAHTWGWATWKRCWKEYDIFAKDLQLFLENGGGLNIFQTKEEACYFNKIMHKLKNNIAEEVTHSWDLQWFFARLKNGSLGIVPCRNLIENVGSGNGTHTSEDFVQIKAEEMPYQIRHPKYMTVNAEYERLHFTKHMCIKQSIIKRVLNKLKCLFNY